MKKNIMILLVALIAVGAGVYFGTPNIVSPKEVTVDVPENLNRTELAQTLGVELDWSDGQQREFASVYGQMQWAEFNGHARDIFVERFDWDASEEEIFLISSIKYLDSELDFFSSVYVSGVYSIPKNTTVPKVAGMFVERMKNIGVTSVQKEFIVSHLDQTAVDNISELVIRETELLPDLVPLPASDITVEKRDGNVLLMFSTTYYNRGVGPLELRADPKTAGIREDIDRDVFQRIYRTNGEYRDKPSGTFLWHQPHLHYHFADFVTYDLEAVEVDGPVPDLSGKLAKTTFCVRDVSKVKLELSNTPEDADYLICYKERQGISVGWGDTYFYNYPDQNINITDLPVGTYKLTFVVNPENRFEEVTRENNTSSVLLKIDAENLLATVLEEVPKDTPEIEHIYLKQEGCSNCTL